MKRLSFRFVRRLMLLLALVFPVVYLMAGFVAALAGSHGNVTLAQDDEVVTFSKVVDFNQQLNLSDVSETTASGVTYSVSDGILYASGTSTGESTSGYVNLYNNSNILIRNHVYYLRFNFLGNNSYTGDSAYSTFPYLVVATPYQEFHSSGIWTCTYPYYFFFRLGIASGSVYFDNFQCSVNVFDLTQMYGAGNEPSDMTFFDNYYDEFYYPYTSSSMIVEETTSTPTYSEYLFNQVLGSDNIIKQWGYYALAKDDEKGFAPFASLIQIVDDNFFHLGDSNDLGLFVYGYVYYALNIVAIYELVALVVMVFTIPLKLTDRFTKEM